MAGYRGQRRNVSYKRGDGILLWRMLVLYLNVTHHGKRNVWRN